MKKIINLAFSPYWSGHCKENQIRTFSFSLHKNYKKDLFRMNDKIFWKIKLDNKNHSLHFKTQLLKKYIKNIIKETIK